MASAPRSCPADPAHAPSRSLRYGLRLEAPRHPVPPSSSLIFFRPCPLPSSSYYAPTTPKPPPARLLQSSETPCCVSHQAMMMMFIGTETLVTQLIHEISRMQACFGESSHNKVSQSFATGEREAAWESWGHSVWRWFRLENSYSSSAWLRLGRNWSLSRSRSREVCAGRAYHWI